MKQFGLRIAAPALAALALLVGGAGTSRAAFMISVTEDGGPTIDIVDGGPLDADGLVNGNITAQTTLLNASLTSFEFATLGGTSNLLLGTPGSFDSASISQTGEVTRLGAGATSITIVASDTGFTFPSGNPKSLSEAASDTYRNTTGGDERTFQSTFDASGSGGSTYTSPLLTFNPPGSGPGPFGTSEPGRTNLIGVEPTPFDLSNTTVITLAGANGSDQFTGATTVFAAVIPEPASLALLGIALPALVVVRRLRRRLA